MAVLVPLFIRPTRITWVDQEAAAWGTWIKDWVIRQVILLLTPMLSPRLCRQGTLNPMSWWAIMAVSNNSNLILIVKIFSSSKCWSRRIQSVSRNLENLKNFHWMLPTQMAEAQIQKGLLICKVRAWTAAA